jgi:hypothetical protein
MFSNSPRPGGGSQRQRHLVKDDGRSGSQKSRTTEETAGSAHDLEKAVRLPPGCARAAFALLPLQQLLDGVLLYPVPSCLT